MVNILQYKKIYIAGHTGMVGSAIMRILKKHNVLDSNIITRLSSELDLTIQSDVDTFFEQEKPDCVIYAAGLAGGITANIEIAAKVIYDNTMIQSNIIHFSNLYNVEKLIYISTSGVYPPETPQPVVESDLIEYIIPNKNGQYLNTKVIGIQMCQAYHEQYGLNVVSVLPSNIYGIKSKYNSPYTQVIPGIIKRMHEAKVNNDLEFKLWGTGKACREFLYSEDFAEAIISVVENYDSPDPINIGSGEDISILELTTMIKNIVGYQGKIVCDYSKPEGVMKRILNSSKVNSTGWKVSIKLKDGLKEIYKDYLYNMDSK